MLQVRLRRDILKHLDHIAMDLELSRAGLVEKFLREKVAEYYLEPEKT